MAHSVAHGVVHGIMQGGGVTPGSRAERSRIPVVARTIGESGHRLLSHERKWHYCTYPKGGREGGREGEKGTKLHTSTSQRNGQTAAVLKTKQAVVPSEETPRRGKQATHHRGKSSNRHETQ